MKKKVVKYKSDLFKQEITLTIDEHLNMLKGNAPVSKKLEKANKDLRGMKLPLIKK